MIVENLTTLNIHKLSKEQYERELEAGRIDENALYLTEGDETSILPEVNADDEGKVLSVVNGEWQASDKLNDLATKDFVLSKIAEIQDGEVIFPKQELTFVLTEDAYYDTRIAYIHTEPFGLQDGETYNVLWNGQKIKCTCERNQVGSIPTDFLLNGIDENGTSVFGIYDLYVLPEGETTPHYDKSIIVDYQATETVTNTVEIRLWKEENINTCNCPEDLIELIEKETIFSSSIEMEKHHFVGDYRYGYSNQESSFGIKHGSFYKIKINEEIHFCQAKTYSLGFGTITYLGNINLNTTVVSDDTGENFLVADLYSSEGQFSQSSATYSTLESENPPNFITVSLEIIETEQKINDKYLPDDLGPNGEGVSSWNNLKDRPFYEGEGYTDIIPVAEASGFTVQDIGFGVNAPMIQSPVKLNFIVGETYRVHWDGTDYDCVAKDASTINIGGQETQLGGAIVLGNASGVGIESEELPFLWGSFTGMDIIMANNNAPSHIIGLAKLEDTIHKLDDKYLDLMKDTSIVMPLRGFGGFMPDQEFGLPFQCAYDFYLDYSVDINKTYEVIWDGTSYTCTPFNADDFFPGGMFLGNGSAMGYPGNGEPFAIGVVPLDDRYAAVYVDMVNSEPGLTHTVQINLVMPEEDKYKIPEKYINTGLPKITSADAGKFLRVSDLGTWVLEEIPLAEEAEL